MTTYTEDFTGTAGELSTGYSTIESGAISRDGSGGGVGTTGEGRGVLRTNETYGNDQIVTWTRTNLTGAVQGGVLRGSGSGTTWNGYRLYVWSDDPANWEIQRVTSGTGTQLAVGPAGSAHTAPQSFEASVSGTVLTLKRAGVTLGTYDTSGDSTKYSSGSPGFYTFGTPTFDDVTFEDVGGGASALDDSGWNPVEPQTNPLTISVW